MINLKNNNLIWFTRVSVDVPIDALWDDPPNYQGITTAVLKAILAGRVKLTEEFFKNKNKKGK